MLRAVVSACVVIAATRAASGDPRALVVTGDACDASSLAGDVAKLGGEPFVDGAHASVHVELVAPTAARVSFDDGVGNVSGPREIAATDCAQLLASIALVVAMMPGPDAPAATPPQPPPPQPQPQPVNDAVEVTRAFEVVAPEPTRWDAVVDGATSVDTHGADAVIAAGVRYRRGSRSLTAELAAYTPVRDDLSVGRVDVLRAELELAPCQHLGALAACGVLAAGALRGSGIGLEQERAVVAPLVALGARLAWEQPLGRAWAVLAHVDGDVLVTTTRFDVDAMTVWTSPRVEVTGGLSLLARFL
jgi:hypothetical protein